MNWTSRYVLKNMKFNFMREPGNKQPSCIDDSKYGEFIPGKSSQQFKIYSHFVGFDTAIGEWQWYDDTSSRDLRCMYKLFESIWLFYSMYNILDLCKILFNAALIYDPSSFSNPVNHNLFKSDWIEMALIQVFHPYVILFMLLIGLYVLACNPQEKYLQ